jgi:hypothetical protein
MQANTMYYKVVAQRNGGFNVLCGFNTKIVFATAERITSACSTATQAQCDDIAVRHAADLNAADVQDCTVGAVAKKLARNAELEQVLTGRFSEMRIGNYL